MKKWVVTLTKGFTDFNFEFDTRGDAREFFELALWGAEKAELEMNEITVKLKILEEK